MGVRGRPESRTLKRNSPIIIYLLTGGGVRVVARNGEPRHAHRTTHRWWGGVLVSFDLARCVCVWWGARVVESAGDGGIVHTSFFTTLLPTVASCGYNVAGLFLVVAAVVSVVCSSPGCRRVVPRRLHFDGVHLTGMSEGSASAHLAGVAECGDT